MRPNISITLVTPHVTIERYSELTGLAEDSAGTGAADRSTYTQQHRRTQAISVRRAPSLTS